MKGIFIAYLSSLFALLIIDGAWLSFTLKRFYAPRIGHLMAGSFQLAPVLAFYLLYTLGITALVVMPALRGKTALHSVFLTGAVLGAVAYGTYDLTNQATLKGWPQVITIVDLVWGTLLTGVSSAVSVYCTRVFE